MGTQAGQFRHRIEILGQASARTAIGTLEGGGWSVLGQRNAKVLYGSGGERRENAKESASQSATFRVRSTAFTRAISTDHRIRHIGLDWDVTGAVPIIGPPDEIEITAVALR